MKAKELVSYWDSPDNSRLTAKQYSMRLPIHVAAKISALCDMYPQKTRTQIVGDLLATALQEVEAALPYEQGEIMEYVDDEPVYAQEGPRAHFEGLTNKYLRELEAEAAGSKS
jgi:hypothetical protein